MSSAAESACMITLRLGVLGHPMPLFEAPAPISFGKLTIAAKAAFVPIGIVTILLGPMLPALSLRWSLNYAQAGRLFTVQLLASTLAVGLSGAIVSRWGFRFAICAGLFAMSVGVVALLLSSYLAGLMCIATYGFGVGLAVPAANLAVAELNPHQRSAALSRLNFFWSFGAVACPFLVAIAARIHRTQLFLTALSVGMLIMMAVVVAIPIDGIGCTQHQGSDIDSHIASHIRWGQRPLLILLGLFFLYVGTEVGFGGWITTYAKGLGTLSTSQAVISPSFFYAALMIGRWAAPFVLCRIAEASLARTGIITACVGMVGMIWSHAAAGVIISGIIAGFGLSAVYPIAISLLSRESGAMAARVGSVMFTLSNLGGACLPWLVGYFSKRFSNPRAGLVVPLISAILLYILFSNWNFAPEESKS
jgi:MFS transporter, FHS family, glucose/mannose:H+ symporter